jgi:histidinol dehydrogenase
MKKALANIEDFHKRTTPGSQRYKAAEGVTLEERVTPIERVGVYVPGGKAFYPSTVLMTVVPAQVAGCREIIVVSPPSFGGTIHPAILAAASLAGATRVFRIGGAQAVAALAYGTKTVPAVDKIVGPGNVYVTVAKRLVAQTVEIDKEAGPSEIVIIADKSADPRWAAADMLSQAEHEEEAVAVLLTDSERLARTVADELEKQLDTLPRKRFAKQALKKRGWIVVVSNLQEAARLSNMRAPEHLSLMVKKPRQLLKLITNAGAIFLGPYSPVAVGDYIAGPSHVLPTGGAARFASALTVNDFLKRSTVIGYTKKRLAKEAADIIKLAEAEGFDAHAESVRLRLKR